MKYQKFALVVVLVAAISALGWSQGQKSLTNKDVTDMVKQGMNEALIVKVIQASDSNFDVSPGGVTQLKADGATQGIIDAMVQAQANKNNSAASATPAASTAPPPASSAPTATPAPADAGGKALLKEGTELPLKFANDLSSKTASEGDSVELTLDGDLKVGDVIVAKSGSRAVAVVSNAKKAGMMGKPGELNIQLQHMTVNGTRVRVRGTKGREGDSKTGTAVALTVLFGPIGLIKHGKNVDVKAGTPLTAYVDEDIYLPATLQPPM